MLTMILNVCSKDYNIPNNTQGWILNFKNVFKVTDFANLNISNDVM